MRIQLPNGVHDGEPFTDQPNETSSDMQNMRPFDPKTGRMRPSQRAGLARQCSVAINGANKIKNLISVTRDNQNVTYAVASPVTVDTSVASRNQNESIGNAVDRQSNVYYIDGKASIVKLNSEGAVLWSLALPIADPAHFVRALLVDAQDRVYAGVSGGGVQTTARVWCYEQADNNTTRQVWQMETGNYVERIKIKDDTLYTAQNKTDSNQAFIIGYTFFDTPNPTESFRRQIAYPVNDLDVSPKDGSLFFASEPNATRGFNPLSPDTTEISEDWTPILLPSFSRRVWGWWDAADADAFAITRVTGSDNDDGGTIDVWFDKSQKGRHWYAASGTNQVGPKFRTKGPAGKPSVHFDGTSSGAGQPGMVSLGATGTTRASREANLAALPTYLNSQWVVVMVVRCSKEAVIRALLGQVGTNPTGTARTRLLCSNRSPAAAIGTTINAGEISLFEEGGVIGTSGGGAYPAPVAPLGVGTTPLGGPMGSNGVTIISWICDGGAIDIPGAASRSLLRINGLPCARWQSEVFSSVNATSLGFAAASASPFSGDICEMLVLSDWEDPSTGIPTSYARLIEHAAAPTDVFSYSTALDGLGGTQRDLEKIEGYLAHKWGASDQLTGGQAGILLANGTLPVANTTVTVGTDVYTFQTAAFTATGNEVVSQGTVQRTLERLANAINGRGVAGAFAATTDYEIGTARSTTAIAYGPFMYNGTAGQYALLIRRLDGRSTTTLTIGTTVAAWGWKTTAVNAVVTASQFDTIAAVGPPVAQLGDNLDWFPHIYYRYKLANQTHGGPPRSDLTLVNPGAVVSTAWLAIASPYGVLGKIDPANGKVRWVATSGYNSQTPGTALGLGGVGYACIVNSLGHIYSVGPRQATDALITGGADNLDIRKIQDLGGTFSEVTGAGANGAWVENPGAFTYHYPRMAIDKYDNVYVPIFQAAAGTSLIGYANIPSGAAPSSGNEILTLTTLTNTPRGYAVSVDPAYPDYPSSFTTTRPEFLYLSTELPSGGSMVTLYKLRLVTQTRTAGSPRSFTNLAVSGGDIRRWDGTTSNVPAGGSNALSLVAQYISSTVFKKKAYFSDGLVYRQYDPLTDAVTAWKSTSAGKIPPRFTFLFTWGGRIGIARSADAPSNWAMSRIFDADDWDFFPPVFSDDAKAVAGDNALAGQPSDIINTVVPINDDLLLFGGDHSIRRLTGNPATLEAQIHLVSDQIGMGFGPSWARDNEGNVYFSASRGGIYVMAPGGEPIPISHGNGPNILRRLQAVDYSAFYMHLVWNDRDNGLHVFQVPYAGGGTIVTHYYWHKATNSWLPDQFGRAGLTGVQPTAAYVLDGDLPADRVMVIGCEDSFIRRFDEARTYDDAVGSTTVAIEARVLVGPIVPDQEDFEARSTALDVLLSSNQGGCGYQLFASQTADLPGQATRAGLLSPGRNKVDALMCGSHMWVKFFNVSVPVATQNLGSRFSIESAHLDLHRAGRKRSFV